MAQQRVKFYNTYNFREKDPVIDQIRTLVEDGHFSYGEISARSGVSATTLYNWFYGTTRRPQHATIRAVLRAIGWDMRLGKMPPSDVKVVSKRMPIVKAKPKPERVVH